MSELSLDPEMNVTVVGRFISRGNNQSLTGDDYTVRLFDKDLFDNDFLGESGLDGNGYAKISFPRSAFSDFSNAESTPDLYFVVYKNGDIIYKSNVMQELDIDAIEQYKKGEGDVIDLGSYLLNI